MFDYNFNDYGDTRFLPFTSTLINNFSLKLKKAYPANLEKMWVPYYHFYMIYKNQEVGYINFRLTNSPKLLSYFGHLGYRVDEAHRGFGYAGQAIKMLSPFIRQHAFEDVIITCHPQNTASKRVLEKLGAQYQKTCIFEDLPKGYDLKKSIYILNVDF